MPIYEYKCLKCKDDFEFFKHLTDETVECPKCGNKNDKKLHKKISANVSHVLNGTGWARDNYANKKKGN